VSIEAMAVVLHHSRARGTDKLILLGIANHSGDGGAWPTIETLARYANVEERSVQRGLNALVKLGELVVHPQSGGNSGTRPDRRPNRYDVIVACPATCDHTMNHRHIPLPTAPADLWITGVTPASPRDNGVTPTSPGRGDAHVTLTVPKEPTTQVGRDLTVPGAARDITMPNCSVCSRTHDECLRRQHVSGHTYAPKRRPAALTLAPILDNYDDIRGAAQ
jgi:hypothetical protein